MKRLEEKVDTGRGERSDIGEETESSLKEEFA